VGSTNKGHLRDKRLEGCDAPSLGAATLGYRQLTLVILLKKELDMSLAHQMNLQENENSKLS
jgi:hypothetical protein